MSIGTGAEQVMDWQAAENHREQAASGHVPHAPQGWHISGTLTGGIPLNSADVGTATFDISSLLGIELDMRRRR